MEGLIARQAEILAEMKRIHTNFKKDSVSRKTSDYVRQRLERLDSLWIECEEKHQELNAVGDKGHQYFTDNIYEVIKSWYQGARQEIAVYEIKPQAGSSKDGQSKANIMFDSTLFEPIPSGEGKITDLLQLQRANFRAFTKIVVSCSIDDIEEKWEIEDILNSLEKRWTAIEKLHLHIDGILEGVSDHDYYEEFLHHERALAKTKRALNVKLNASVHQQQTVPKIDIPIFNGNYTLWPTFMDLYLEAIHNNPAIAKTQKMQHLKGRLRGEAEKLVQHLHIAPENYDTCWEILTHRYNNRLHNGRYEVRLPMKPNYEQLLGKSKPLAVAQFMQLERKLSRDDTLSASYIKFMQEYVEMGHMIESKPDNKPSCYLPHHGVLKQSSLTTKMRVVFNASQKTDSGYSLNDLMECGPKLHQDLLTLLMGWRLYKYVFTADCEKMYRMILVTHEDQHLQKIMWREGRQEPLKEYRLCTITYGTKAAPFLALRALQQLAQDEAEKYPLAANIISNEMYVDDVCSGSNSIEQAQEMQEQLINMLRGAGFTLRKWSSNNPTLIDSLASSELNQTTMHFTNDGTTKALGLQWNPTMDTFAFTNTINSDTNQLTKRRLLSEISKIFDPLGWLTPLTLKAKLMFQSVWLLGCDWDDILPISVQEQWKQFTYDLHNITQFEIPRWLGDTTNAFQVHGFCDASEKAYACAIYLLTLNDKKERVIRLITAKSRLSPNNKKLTLPRLELCGALLLARLMNKVLKAFKWDTIHQHTYAWTDSMIVLSWLHGDVNKWKSFVSNRVQQVCNVIPKQHWNYVKSEDNAADCASRGISCSQLLQHTLWWQGPEWLKTYNEATADKIEMIPTICEAKHKQIISCVVQPEPSSIVLELLYKYSDMTRITRCLAWIKRFIKNAVNAEINTSTYLTSTELDSAEKFIVKQIQGHIFKDEIVRLKENRCVNTRSSILSLNPFLCKDGILRVGGRLRNSNLMNDTKHPIILPHDHILTELLIWQAHTRTLHGGPKLALTHLRQKWWAVGGLRAVKKILRKCVTCRRFKAQQYNQIMADLPSTRVTISRPFTHTGVDFTGHIEIKANKGRSYKMLLAYVAVFVCLTTKAIHLELVTELTSTAFLSAFKRFCARRGTPRDMYSDNGTNFVGANRILLQQYKSVIETVDNCFLNKISEMGIKWHFNAPSWPSAGGLWEAAVKSMKYHLKRIIGDQRLTYEEFSTLLCQIEACLNSRPLCTVTESTEEIDCLTPGHFLTGTSLMTVAEPDNDNTYHLSRRWQVVQKLCQDFWKKWSQEYLQQLQARLKWKRQDTDPRENDIVCIKDENLPAGKWALGRVIKLHPGKDGHTRVVTLKTAKGITKRPATKLVPLVEVVEEKRADTDNNTLKDKRNRSKKCTWNSLICYALLLIMTLITPTMQQDIKLTPLTKNQTIYFDKIAELQEIRDEWKLVFYYNMTHYWQNVESLKQFVTHLKQFREDNWLMQFQILINQLEQNTNELSYYNDLLKSQHIIQHRFKRGLIDGVGYVANSLFGVLDQRFADKYEQDISTIQHNENHLLQLLKNQTSILETEHNIVQRNEATMIKHLNLINEHLKNLEINTIRDQGNSEKAFYIFTSILAAETVVQNLKDTQQTIINTLTNMNRGHLDVHLISPSQMRTELDKIARQLPRDCILPAVQYDVRDIYKLFRIHARITQQYLLMEIKIPILNYALFELSKLISIPQRIDNNRVMYVIPSADLIAFNPNRYSFIPLEPSDFQECQKIHDTFLMCKLNHPVYMIGDRRKSICDMQLIRNNEQHNLYCHTVIKACADRWVKLHKQNTWFYYCCGTCEVQITCGSQMSTKELRHTGLITLERGCELQGDTFMLYAHTDYSSNVLVNAPNPLIMPTISPINNIINTSIRNSSLLVESHDETFKKINTELQSIKEQSKLDTLSSHDYHHYIMIYVVITITSSLFIISVCFWRKITRQQRQKTGSGEAQSRSEEDDIQDGYSKIKKRDIKVQSDVNKVRNGNISLSEVKFDTAKHDDVC